MRQSWMFFSLTLIFVIAFNSVSVVHAYPPCGSYQPQTDSNGGSFCRPVFLGNELARIKDALPFAWVRAYPDSQSEVIIATILPSRNATLMLNMDQQGNSFIWDGHPWWWHVRLCLDQTGYQGWIEQESLVTIANPAPETYPPDAPAPWQTPSNAGVKHGIPFVWLRDLPNSQARVIITVLSSQSFTLQSNAGPQFDEVQWWWLVEHRSGANSWQGWVEQSSIRIMP
jgi:hypothetical protein